MLSILKQLFLTISVIFCLSACDGNSGDSNSNAPENSAPLPQEPSPATPAYGPNAFAYEGVGIDKLSATGLSGLGVDVCVVDTGIDAAHPAFAHLFARGAVKWADFTTENSPNPIDSNGHGTHVAGIIAMNGELTGGAPNVNLLVARVFTADGGTDSGIIAAAVDWCRANAADIISMSLGGLTLPAIEALLEADATESEAAVERALNAGIYVVAAAGNTEIARDVATPAGVAGVIAVGAVEQDLETKAIFSQSGVNEALIIPSRIDPNKKPEVVAPGVDINSAIAANSTLAEDVSECNNTNYCKLSGTSQATPFVTAALALVLEDQPALQHEHLAGDPSEAIDFIKHALAQSAAKLPGQDQPHDDGVGYGLIQADALTDVLAGNIPLEPIGDNANATWNNATCQIDDDGSSHGSGELAVSAMVLVADSDPTDRVDNGTTLYYPTILAESSCTFKVIGWGNGTTGSGGAHYPEYFNHLASHGFVVAVAHTNMAAAEDQPVLISVNLVMAENGDSSSIFYQKIDPEFGLMGKSQGAFAVARALNEPNAIAGALIATGSGEEFALSKPGLFATGDSDFAQPTVINSFGLATSEAIYAQAIQPTNPEDDPAAGHMDLDDRKGVVELATSFMRCHLRDDANTCQFVACESCQIEPWSDFQTKNTAVADDNGTGLGFPIEDTYSMSGPFDVTRDSTDTDYHIYYPTNMTSNHSVITWGNAAGGVPGGYNGLLEHLASWGFVVVATTSGQSTGELLVGGVDFMAAKNNDPSSAFYSQLNLEVVGAAGHSLGGGGAIRAGSLDSRIQVIAPISAAPDDSTQQEGSMFILGGSEDSIINPNLLQRTYDNADLSPTILGTLEGAGHTHVMLNGREMRGYITAWFMAELQNDSYAQGAFFGHCEICGHLNWTVQMKNTAEGG